MSKRKKDRITRKDIREWSIDHGAEEALLADGFEDAFLGFTDGSWGKPQVAVYSRQRMIKVLIKRDKMTVEEAFEYLTFNVWGAYVGERTPTFIDEFIL